MEYETQQTIPLINALVDVDIETRAFIKGKNFLLIFFFSILVHIVSELAIHLLNVRAKVEKQLEIVPQGKKTLIYFIN